ncbi:MAG: hypothetical protein ACTHLD_10410, partial [Chitinophaga sp.]
MDILPEKRALWNDHSAREILKKRSVAPPPAVPVLSAFVESPLPEVPPLLQASRKAGPNDAPAVTIPSWRKKCLLYVDYDIVLR